ncbi:MAG: glyoxalase/bleomycin resistance/extradiol dioxygenase family protein [Myxococcales bacterium]|nr:MAG: glyoxalase/bleomycin resistance/extradiol dioxygenase family protein [Myxococcales bacterium]
MQQLNPYLNYNGDAAKAVELYRTALGAEVVTLSRFGDAPGASAPPETKDRVMHAVLKLGDAGTIMLSDIHPGMPHTPGTNAYVCLSFDDAAGMAQQFEALAVGGQVTMPLEDTFWGAKFGMLMDAFGVRWMFNCEKKG